MNNEIQLINDGDGVALIGDPTVVDRFLASHGLQSRELKVQRRARALGAGSGAVQAGAEIAANSGRWVKLTEKSAAALKQSKLMTGSQPGYSRAVLTEDGGKIKGILEIVKTPGSLMANPAVLAGAAGLMAQFAMQQAMDEITDYLATIDAKIDDVLRAQNDAVLSDMIGVDFVIEEAMIIREQVGKVSEVTWSKVQNTALTIGRTQAYALLRLDAIANKLEHNTKIGDLAKAAQEAESKTQEWLAVLARCAQLQDAIAVLELDRVLDAASDELDQHRVGLRTARQKRLELISGATRRLMARLEAAVGAANSKVLLHPSASRVVVTSSSQVTKDVVDFQERLGIDGVQHSLEARRWLDAATDMKDMVFEKSADGLGGAKRTGAETLDRARSVGGRITSGMAQRVPRRSREEESNRD